MITVLFFAHCRELIGCTELHIDYQSSFLTVNDIIDVLDQMPAIQYTQKMKDIKIIVAVNQEIVTTASAIFDGDEIAFFPPVSGG